MRTVFSWSVSAMPSRTVSGWIFSRPETLTEPEQLRLKTVRNQCPNSTPSPDTSGLRDHAHRPRQGERLPAWLDAVTAGLTLPRSSGVVEGHVNRIKMLKRQMLGRAGFRLLGRRVPLA